MNVTDNKTDYGLNKSIGGLVKASVDVAVVPQTVDKECEVIQKTADVLKTKIPTVMDSLESMIVEAVNNTHLDVPITNIGEAYALSAKFPLLMDVIKWATSRALNLPL